MSYISKVQIDGTSAIPIGSSLYGICDTPVGTGAKTVTANWFDTPIPGVTVHIKFSNGNNVSVGSSFTLTVGSVGPYPISNPGGSINWSSGAVISFTLDGTTDDNYKWIVNDSDSGQQVTIVNTYSSTSTDAISGSGVADAIAGLQLGDASKKGVVTSIVESGEGANKTSTDLPTTNAIVGYIDGKLTGLTGAMHFKGAVAAIPPASGTYAAGDVVLLTSTNKEYVYDGSAWIELGDEGSYALKSSTGTMVTSVTLTPNTLPQLTITAVAIPNVTSLGTTPTLTTTAVSIPNVTSAGSAADFEVTSGVLVITKGTAPTLGTNITVDGVDSWDAGSTPAFGTDISVGSASGWNAGGQASISTTTGTAIVPTSSGS